jgi:hypothetical protein
VKIIREKVIHRHKAKQDKELQKMESNNTDSSNTNLKDLDTRDTRDTKINEFSPIQFQNLLKEKERLKSKE